MRYSGWILIGLITILGITNSYAQKDTTATYLDEDWQIVKKSSDYAYLRKRYEDNHLWHTIDYNPEGILIAKGSFNDKKLKVKQGVFRTFYKDGKVKSQTNYNRGLIVGESVTFYPSGNIDSKLVYNNQGNLVQSSYFKEDGTNSQYKIAEFPGGDAAMYRFIGSNIMLNWKISEGKKQGKVNAIFTVSPTGHLSNVSVPDSPSKAITEEVKRLISIMPVWKAAIRDDVPTSSEYTLPISFL